MRTLTLTDGANRFLHTLRDLGFLDARLEAAVLDRAMERCPDVVNFEEIRRVVAEVAFEQRSSSPLPGFLDFLDDEWKLIFH